MMRGGGEVCIKYSLRPTTDPRCALRCARVISFATSSAINAWTAPTQSRRMEPLAQRLGWPCPALDNLVAALTLNTPSARSYRAESYRVRERQLCAPLVSETLIGEVPAVANNDHSVRLHVLKFYQRWRAWVPL
jgi:hypothetical protein